MAPPRKLHLDSLANLSSGSTHATNHSASRKTHDSFATRKTVHGPAFQKTSNSLASCQRSRKPYDSSASRKTSNSTAFRQPANSGVPKPITLRRGIEGWSATMETPDDQPNPPSKPPSGHTPLQNVDAGNPLDDRLMGKLSANVEPGKPRDDEFIEKCSTPTNRHAGQPLADEFMGPAVALHPHRTVNWHVECALQTPHLFNVPTPTQNVDAGKPLDDRLSGKLSANVEPGKPRDDKFVEKCSTPTKRKADCNLEIQRHNPSPIKHSKPSPPLVTPPTHVLCSHMSPGHDTSLELVPPSQFYSTDDEYSCYSDHDDSSQEAFLINPKKPQT